MESSNSVVRFSGLFDDRKDVSGRASNRAGQNDKLDHIDPALTTFDARHK